MFNQTYHQVGTVVNVAGDFTLNQNSSKDDLVKALGLVLEQAKQDETLKGAGDDTAGQVESAVADALDQAKSEAGSKDTVVDRLNQASEVLSGVEKTASAGWELAKTVKAIAGWAAVFLA